MLTLSGLLRLSQIIELKKSAERNRYQNHIRYAVNVDLGGVLSCLLTTELIIHKQQ